MARKSAKKSASSPRRGRGRPFVSGDPRAGRGPAPGAPNAGRPPDEFKRIMQGIVSRDEAVRRLAQLASGEKTVSDEIFLKAFKESADRGYGKAVQPLEHAGPDGGPIPLESPEQARDRITRELDGIAARQRTGKDSR